eukprot:GHVR01172764.1.p1 GENE.GHVR01172764.1~~GHVR01172764.1.p1  ORF type:complete len:382 (+),score=46.30 GHVR01172764.1:1076-2221(+)
MFKCFLNLYSSDIYLYFKNINIYDDFLQSNFTEEFNATGCTETEDERDHEAYGMSYNCNYKKDKHSNTKTVILHVRHNNNGNPHHRCIIGIKGSTERKNIFYNKMFTYSLTQQEGGQQDILQLVITDKPHQKPLKANKSEISVNSFWRRYITEDKKKFIGFDMSYPKTYVDTTEFTYIIDLLPRECVNDKVKDKVLTAIKTNKYPVFYNGNFKMYCYRSTNKSSKETHLKETVEYKEERAQFIKCLKALNVHTYYFFANKKSSIVDSKRMNELIRLLEEIYAQVDAYDFKFVSEQDRDTKLTLKNNDIYKYVSNDNIDYNDIIYSKIDPWLFQEDEKKPGSVVFGSRFYEREGEFLYFYPSIKRNFFFLTRSHTFKIIVRE